METRLYKFIAFDKSTYSFIELNRYFKTPMDIKSSMFYVTDPICRIESDWIEIDEENNIINASRKLTRDLL